MKAASLALCAVAPFALLSCSAEDPAPAAPPISFVVWPEDGSTVFADCAVYVGDPASVGSVDGTIAVVVGGDGVAEGAAMPAGAMAFEPGATFGYVTLPVGQQKVHVQHFGADGKATGDHKTVSYTVEATPADLGVQWLEPAEGATVTSPFQVRFGVTGAGMSPAGQNALDKTVGHHHISIGKGVVTPGYSLPMNTGDYLHYGKAQTEAEVTLAPGTYELTMQFADAAHRSYGKALASKTIKVTVQ